ncbi:Nickel import ATP-binding protein NikO [Budvicia aquatica]|uniref:Nickel import ATP-binding protein NikO n=1 Tax=Budvicia aquatica TaxID=82979 RepID=A0A484ZGG3_9GAMM|nr:Nickel import ATP-binding protein NikO [Budvicia aquatica]
MNGWLLSGPNGVGKTTLLRTIAGLEYPEAGEVILFGQACKREAEFRIQRPRIGFLFQESDDQLFCRALSKTLHLAPATPACLIKKPDNVPLKPLDKLGIAHLAERFTHRLSGGEKRLVCLAGLLAMRPDVLLLDEPTNGVDAENGAKLRTALLTFDGAILLVSHDEHFVTDIATRAMVLSAKGLHEANIHQHLHQHHHPHIHPKLPKE